jgi:hypothetical protein
VRPGVTKQLVLIQLLVATGTTGHVLYVFQKCTAPAKTASDALIAIGTSICRLAAAGGGDQRRQAGATSALVARSVRCRLVDASGDPSKHGARLTDARRVSSANGSHQDSRPSKRPAESQQPGARSRMSSRGNEFGLASRRGGIPIAGPCLVVGRTCSKTTQGVRNSHHARNVDVVVVSPVLATPTTASRAVVRPRDCRRLLRAGATGCAQAWQAARA